MIICSCCGRDIDAILQDNCSATPGYPLCEDCAGIHGIWQPDMNDYGLERVQAEYDRQEPKNESEEES